MSSLSSGMLSNSLSAKALGNTVKIINSQCFTKCYNEEMSGLTIYFNKIYINQYETHYYFDKVRFRPVHDLELLDTDIL